jgi:hypothetical protein
MIKADVEHAIELAVTARAGAAFVVEAFPAGVQIKKVHRVS